MPPADCGSREATVLHYAYLCRRAARRFYRSGLEHGDLEQVATIGLLKAVDRYDVARGTPFEAFAWLAIVGELLHHIRDFEHSVRLPRGLRESLPRLRRGADRLMQRLEREPTDVELAVELGESVAGIRAMRRAAVATIRRDDPGTEREVEAASALDSAGWCERLDLRTALDRLPARERRVVLGSLVLGLTNVELGDHLALSTRHVARLRQRALAKMQGVCALGLSA